MHSRHAVLVLIALAAMGASLYLWFAGRRDDGLFIGFMVVAVLALLLLGGFILASVLGMRSAEHPHARGAARPVSAGDPMRPRRILIATDGSSCSQVAVESLVARLLPPGSKVAVVSVVHTNVPFVPEPFLTGAAAHVERLEEDREQAPIRVKAAVDRLTAALGMPIESVILEGDPAKAIVEEARRWEADLVVVGTHGRGGIKRLALGSVAEAVVAGAPCSVEVVRCAEAA